MDDALFLETGDREEDPHCDSDRHRGGHEIQNIGVRTPLDRLPVEVVDIAALEPWSDGLKDGLRHAVLKGLGPQRKVNCDQRKRDRDVLRKK
jgi:hypothetical protein